MTFVERIQKIVKHPFAVDGDIWDFILLLILCGTVSFLWSRILNQITTE